jgi:FMN phosphatase YigB (HAD superfamily)
MSFDLDHTLWDFDKNSDYFEGIFKKAIEIKTFIEKYVPINQACWKLYQYDKISHEELRYNRLRHSLMRSIILCLMRKLRLLLRSISNYYQITTSF